MNKTKLFQTLSRLQSSTPGVLSVPVANELINLGYVQAWGSLLGGRQYYVLTPKGRDKLAELARDVADNREKARTLSGFMHPDTYLSDDSESQVVEDAYDYSTLPVELAKQEIKALSPDMLEDFKLRFTAQPYKGYGGLGSERSSPYPHLVAVGLASPHPDNERSAEYLITLTPAAMEAYQQMQAGVGSEGDAPQAEQDPEEIWVVEDNAQDKTIETELIEAGTRRRLFE